MIIKDVLLKKYSILNNEKYDEWEKLVKEN